MRKKADQVSNYNEKEIYADIIFHRNNSLKFNFYSIQHLLNHYLSVLAQDKFAMNPVTDNLASEVPQSSEKDLSCLRGFNAFSSKVECFMPLTYCVSECIFRCLIYSHLLLFCKLLFTGYKWCK